MSPPSMLECYVYILTNPLKNGEPFYVGKGSGTRFSDHFRESEERTNNLHKFSTIQKIREHGLEPGVWFPASELSETEAYEIEEQFIKFYGRKRYDGRGCLTNICAGGPTGCAGWNRGLTADDHASIREGAKKRLGSKRSEETRNRMKAAQQINQNRPETKMAKSKAMMGKVGGMAGKKQSEEAKKKIGAANAIKLKGRKRDPEAVRKTIETMRRRREENESAS